MECHATQQDCASDPIRKPSVCHLFNNSTLRLLLISSVLRVLRKHGFV